MPHSPPARLTAPLAVLDRPLNALNDGSIRVAPWLVWPLSPPRRDETLPPALYVQLAAQALLGQAATEALQRRSGTLLAGRALQRERALTWAVSVVGTVLAAGAWDRRAARLRARPANRLLARLTR